jgi:hypothetical protein
MRIGRGVLAVALAGVMMVVGAAHVDAAAKKKRSGGGASGTVTLQTKSVSVGLGWSWGSGKLRFKGRSYPFKIDGIAVNAVGVSANEATGYVYDLKRLSDFEGTYTAIAAGGTLGGGKGILSMKNANDVRITLHSTSRGLEVRAAPEGIKITLEN